MPIISDTSDGPAVVRFIFEGEWASALELIEIRRGLIRAGHLTAKSAVLFDLRYATGLPNIGDVRHALMSAQRDHVLPVCRAFLVQTSDQYEIARQLQALGPQSLINAIFQDETMALEWLAAVADRTCASKT